jgi:hypothetical protein
VFNNCIAVKSMICGYFEYITIDYRVSPEHA